MVTFCSLEDLVASGGLAGEEEVFGTGRGLASRLVGIAFLVGAITDFLGTLFSFELDKGLEVGL